ncbi:MAG: hypothetical protein JNL98_16460 [Bryobacterales bacterium]|nr:hypothetical protein [Bryobacterales bacterium]
MRTGYGDLWEETLFNNIMQIGAGSAVGFGQSEPAEFYKISARGLNSKTPLVKQYATQAQQKGYLVHGLPPVNGRYSAGPLTDEQAVQAPMALIRTMFEQGRSKMGILGGYAGVGFVGEQPEHLKGTGRQKIISDWLKCEAKLIGAIQARDSYEIFEALRKARPFTQNELFWSILFPNEPSYLIAEAEKLMPSPLPIRPGPVRTTILRDRGGN